MFRRLIAPTALIAVLAVTALVAAPVRPTPALAANGSISVTPATQPVAAGSTFTVTIAQSADVATTGAQATISFDPSLLQLQSIQAGPAYAAATLLLGEVPGEETGQSGQPQTPEEAVASANQTGVILNAATFLTPGSGTVPAGENVFIVLTMNAVAAAGTSAISLTSTEMIDDQYGEVPVAATNGEVVIGGAGVPPPGTPASGATTPAGATTPSAGATAPATGATPAVGTTAIATVLGTSKAPSLKSATFAISPATQKVAKEATFTFTVTQQVDGAATNAQAVVSFKKDIMEIVKLQPGTGWKADSKALDAAIAAANGNGELSVTLTADKDKPPATSGESTILTVTMKGRAGKEGKSAIKLVSTDITGTDGDSAPVTAKDGEVIVGSAGGGSSMLLIIIGVVAAIVVLGGGGALALKQRGS